MKFKISWTETTRKEAYITAPSEHAAREMVIEGDFPEDNVISSETEFEGITMAEQLP